MKKLKLSAAMSDSKLAALYAPHVSVHLVYGVV